MKAKLAFVLWEDAGSRDGWSTEEPTILTLTVWSVGWLVAESDTAITLAPNVVFEGNPQRCCEISIPKGSIRMKKVIRI